MTTEKSKRRDRENEISSLSGFERFSCEERAEIMRKKSRYRELILSGRIVLPHEKAAELLGPDCLYHLYAVSRSESKLKRRR